MGSMCTHRPNVGVSSICVSLSFLVRGRVIRFSRIGGDLALCRIVDEEPQSFTSCLCSG